MSLSQILALETILEGAYRREEYPATSYQAELWSTGRPLEGLTILDATPVYRNTFAKYRGLLMAGAELIVGLSDVMPCDGKIVEKLKVLDIPVVRADDPERSVDIILDCAGSFANWNPRIGYVELTRSGVYKYEGKNKPVYLADSGRIKKIETCLGTGESYYRSMKTLGYEDWDGKKILIFGTGKVGTGLVMYARRKGAIVTVVTSLPKMPEHLKPLVEAVIDYHDAEATAAAVREADAVVTATGIPGAATYACSPDVFINCRAVLANMGVEDEYGPGVPEDRVLEKKRPLNFMLEEPTLIRYIDATMALHNAGALYLAVHPESKGLIVPSEHTEHDLLHVTRRDGIIKEEMDMIP